MERWSVRVPTLPFHLFPAAAFLPLLSGKWLRPCPPPLLRLHGTPSLFPNSSGPRPVPRDVFPVSFSHLPDLLGYTLPGRLSSLETPWLAAARTGRTRDVRARFRPHFPFSTRLPGDRKRIATNHSLSTTTQAARSRASVGWPPIDSTFLRRSILICSLLPCYLFVTIDVRGRDIGPARIARRRAVSFRKNLPLALSRLSRKT